MWSSWNKKYLIDQQLSYKKDKADKKDTVLNDWVFNLEALVKSPNYGFVKEVLVYYRFHEDSIYSDRLNANPRKFLDEFLLRKKYYKKIFKIIGANDQIEEFYSKRSLKILRTLVSKKIIATNVMIEILKSNSIKNTKKIQLLFFYLTAIIFGMGINKLKIF